MSNGKHPGGRPTKYNPKYCQEIKDYMAQGKSKEAFAGHIGVSKQRIYDWAERFVEFRYAIKEAEALCQDFWEEMGIQMALAGQGNATVWIFNMKNRFNWRDKIETEISGKDGQSLLIRVVQDKEQIEEMKGDGNTAGDKELPETAEHI